MFQGSLRFPAAAMLVALALGASACGGSSPLSPSSRADTPDLPLDAGFGRFSDVPIPKGADMDTERSLVLGNREAWVGRLVMKVSDRTGTMYDFYARQMPGFGWQPVTSVRSDVSVLTFTRGDRVATVQLLSRTLWGSEIWLTVSPHGEAAPAGGIGNPAQGFPAPSARAEDSVRSAPLR
jgi:hypothetical protein